MSAPSPRPPSSRGGGGPLPWSSQITNVFIDVGDFFHVDDDSGEWIPVLPRNREFWDQHEATARFTDALARFLAAPPSTRVIERLSLKFILTRRDLVRRIGALVAHAVDAGAVKNVELEIVTELSRVHKDSEARTKLGYGDRFKHLLKDCPGAFRSLTKLTLQNLLFRDPAVVNDLVRGCDALEYLSVKFCGFLAPGVWRLWNVDEATTTPELLIDAPQSRLKTLVCYGCHISRVRLAQAPALVTLSCRWFYRFLPPISLGCAPSSLKSLILHHHMLEDVDATWKLSELLINGGQVERLVFVFDNGKIWLEPERPKELRAALGSLKQLCLKNISPDCDLSWTLFVLEAAPLLETIDIHIFDHICRHKLCKPSNSKASMARTPSSPDFKHHSLKRLSVYRTFGVLKYLPFARLIMELAVNLESVTLVPTPSTCEDCGTAELKCPDLASLRLRYTDKDHILEKLKQTKDVHVRRASPVLSENFGADTWDLLLARESKNLDPNSSITTPLPPPKSRSRTLSSPPLLRSRRHRPPQPAVDPACPFWPSAGANLAYTPAPRSTSRSPSAARPLPAAYSQTALYGSQAQGCRGGRAPSLVIAAALSPLIVWVNSPRLARSSLQTATNPNRRRRTAAAMVRCSNGLLGLLNAGAHKDSVMECMQLKANE
ncbi:hypothetical protein EJB05_52323, partial [Eragrostis curvula]